MEKYFYTKQGINSEVLVEAIQLRTTVRSEFIGCFISEKLDVNGVILNDNIEIQFTRALVSSELDEITGIINMIGPMYDLMIRKNIEKNTMSWAQRSGMTLMAQLGANNLYLGKTDAQVDALVADYPDFIHSMLTGSLTATYRILLNMVADANISQPEIDEFKLRVEILLGL